MRLQENLSWEAIGKRLGRSGTRAAELVRREARLAGIYSEKLYERAPQGK